MQVMGMVAVSRALRRDKLDGSGTVSGRFNNPGKLTSPFPAKTVVAVYPMRNCCACSFLSVRAGYSVWLASSLVVAR